MKELWLSAFLACACLAGRAGEPAAISVGHNGSISLRLPGDTPKRDTVLIQFGLPQVAPQERSQESGVLRTVWMTNGTRYEQTVLVCDLSAEAAGTVPKRVLLVNIAGHNTHSEYAHASAELSVEIGGKRQMLEFTGGLVWRTNGANRSLVGALDIPAPGVNVSGGGVLLFSGNMPPSEKGSMTLKLPLDASEGDVDLEELRDLVFSEELRRYIKFRTTEGPSPGELRLFFAAEAGAEVSPGNRVKARSAD